MLQINSIRISPVAQLRKFESAFRDRALIRLICTLTVTHSRLPCVSEPAFFPSSSYFPHADSSLIINSES